MEVEGSLEEGVVEEGVEEVGGMWGLLMDHLLFPFLKVMGRAGIWMQRFVFFASLETLSLLASLMRDVLAITLSSSLAAEVEVNAGSGPADALSLPTLTRRRPADALSLPTVTRAPSLSLESSLIVHVAPGLTPGDTLWGGRVVPGGAVHVITDSSVLLPSLQ